MDKGKTKEAGTRRFRGTGLYWNLIGALVVVVAIIVGIVQNGQTVRLKYLAWTVGIPLGVALLVTIVLTVAVASLVGVMLRRQRRHQLTEAAELRELRQQAHPTEPEARGADAPAVDAVAAGHRPGASA